MLLDDLREPHKSRPHVDGERFEIRVNDIVQRGDRPSHSDHHIKYDIFSPSKSMRNVALEVCDGGAALEGETGLLGDERYGSQQQGDLLAEAFSEGHREVPGTVMMCLTS